jgi:hypothetical protein
MGYGLFRSPFLFSVTKWEQNAVMPIYIHPHFINSYIITLTGVRLFCVNLLQNYPMTYLNSNLMDYTKKCQCEYTDYTITNGFDGSTADEHLDKIDKLEKKRKA